MEKKQYFRKMGRRKEEDGRSLAQNEKDKKEHMKTIF